MTWRAFWRFTLAIALGGTVAGLVIRALERLIP